MLCRQAAEREERAQARKEAKAKAEREEREHERVLELARIQADKEIQLAKINAPIPLQPSFANSAVMGPSLPIDREGEDIGAYLTRFERIAELSQNFRGTSKL